MIEVKSFARCQKYYMKMENTFRKITCNFNFRLVFENYCSYYAAAGRLMSLAATDL